MKHQFHNVIVLLAYLSSVLPLDAQNAKRSIDNVAVVEGRGLKSMAIVDPVIAVSSVEYGIRYQIEGSNTAQEKTVRSDENASTRSHENTFESTTTDVRKLSISAGAKTPSSDGIFNFGMNFNADSEAKLFTKSASNEKYEETQRQFREFFSNHESKVSYGTDSGFARSEIRFVNDNEQEIIIKNVKIALVQLTPDQRSIQKVLVNGCLRNDNSSISAASGKNSECDSTKNRSIHIPPQSSRPPELIESVYFEGLRTDVMLASIPLGSTLDLRIIDYDLSFASKSEDIISRSDVRTALFRDTVEVIIAGSSVLDQHKFIGNTDKSKSAILIRDIMDFLRVPIIISSSTEGQFISKLGADSAEFVLRDRLHIPDVPLDAHTWIVGIKGSAAFGLDQPIPLGSTIYIGYVTRQTIEDANWHVRRRRIEQRIEPSYSPGNGLDYCLSSLAFGDQITIEFEIAQTKAIQSQTTITTSNFKSYRPKLYSADGFFNPEAYNILETTSKDVWSAAEYDEIAGQISWTASNFENIESRTARSLNGKKVCEDTRPAGKITCMFQLSENAYDSSGGQVCLKIARRTSAVSVGRSGVFPSTVGEMNHLMAIKGWNDWVKERPLSAINVWDGLEMRLRSEIKSSL